MTIGMQSAPELYGFFLGWIQYDQAWVLLQQTGLVFMPFILLLCLHSVPLYVSRSGPQAVSTSIKHLSMDCIGALFVIMVACVPCIPLTAYYNQSPSNQTQTTYDQAFTLPPKTVQPTVPIWWYGVIAISEGITQGLIDRMPTVNLRTLITRVNLTRIDDPHLRQALQHFYEQCYLPARQKFFMQLPTQAPSATSTSPATQSPWNWPSTQSLWDWLSGMRAADEKTVSAPDVNWLGSKTFLTTPGYYDSLRATQAVAGFKFHATVDWQDQQFDKFDDNTDKIHWGRPSCVDWWTDTTVGLREQLRRLVPHDDALFKQLAGSIGEENKVVVDDAIKSLLMATGYQAANHSMGSLSYSHAMEGIGVLYNGLKSYPKLYAILQAAPIARAMLLLLFCTFLPFGLVLSRYRLAALMTGSLFLFSLIFWAYIWQLVGWIDEALIKALYGENLFQNYSPQAFIADGVVGLLVIVAPIFWFTVMGILGVSAGRGLSRFLGELVGPSGSAAATGGNIAESALSASTTSEK